MIRFHYIFHTLAYYLAWTICIMLAVHGYAWLNTLLALILISAQYYWQYRISHQILGLNYFIILVAMLGTCVDTLLIHAGLITFASNPFAPYLSPPWMIAIWISFAMTFYSVLSNLFNRLFLLSLLALVGFSLSYAIGVHMGAALFPHGYGTALLIGLIWMLLLPLCIYFYKSSKGTRC